MLAAGAGFPAQAFDGEGVDEYFYNPKIGGKRADGCYSWPGPCRSKEQARAYCRTKGYVEVADFDTSNEVGAFSTKRLGDGGVCRLSCTVLTMVHCFK